MNNKRKPSQLHKWIGQIFDPIFTYRGIKNYLTFFLNWYSYNHLSSDPIQWINAFPQLHDKTKTTTIDFHYFYVNGWAMRRVVKHCSPPHIDIGSQTIFANLLSAVCPVTFVDYRPLKASLTGLTSLGADILHLPFPDNSVRSLSCLHVVEHIGLGRYGDQLNPSGSRDSCKELARILCPGGYLYFALPVGKPKVCFNAHRIHAPITILEYFSELELVELSGVHDDGRFVERVDIDEFSESDYACGMFVFKK